MNKNWNDRADKDLFFTILSVKNIGVISGAEWTTIGNHMRTMGYGFTNEGCRYVLLASSLLSVIDRFAPRARLAAPWPAADASSTAATRAWLTSGPFQCLRPRCRVT